MFLGITFYTDSIGPPLSKTHFQKDFTQYIAMYMQPVVQFKYGAPISGHPTNFFFWYVFLFVQKKYTQAFSGW